MMPGEVPGSGAWTITKFVGRTDTRHDWAGSSVYGGAVAPGEAGTQAYEI